MILWIYCLSFNSFLFLFCYTDVNVSYFNSFSVSRYRSLFTFHSPRSVGDKISHFSQHQPHTQMPASHLVTEFPQYPQYQVLVTLFDNVSNSADIRKELLAANPEYEIAFVSTATVSNAFKTSK